VFPVAPAYEIALPHLTASIRPILNILKILKN
jgi:hypothetical protein